MGVNNYREEIKSILDEKPEYRELLEGDIYSAVKELGRETNIRFIIFGRKLL